MIQMDWSSVAALATAIFTGGLVWVSIRQARIAQEQAKIAQEQTEVSKALARLQEKLAEAERMGLIPFYANAFVLGHQWNRVCRLRVSGSWARTRHRSATTSIISSRS